MNRTYPLPPGLTDAFTIADARRYGVGRKRLNAPDLEHPFRGVFARKPLDVSTNGLNAAEAMRTEVIRLARAYSTRMGPGEFFSHTTAATLWGVPLPTLRDIVLDVAVFRPRRAPKATGLRGHSLDPRLCYVTERNGLRLTTPASTWASLGSLLAPYDLVAAGDAIVCSRTSDGRSFSERPLATLAQLQAAIDAGRRPGVQALRNSVGRVRSGSWSRLESWVRLILVDAGLPEPVLNFDAYDDAGNFLGCLDLAYPDLKIAIEYEGQHHWSTPAQIQHDIDRLDRLVENGWRIVRLTKEHVFRDPAEVVRRVVVARAQRSTAR
ncbi:endonuclease domain-containing protein [Mycetocola zhadangensis]|uniref:DUF559 domain-containing protein n=1 Tax=Mycetocola zhadangensis TaxID=1164595 RepID=A0A3L7IUJ5_9MICO|nr:hypothetical protein [Mycetocola zhadangensis]RLQ80981.1 hypothetical protein D9V28_14590 [Mycetocola zhadangensis]GGF03680.1 hypothetical protein GCM10011313_28480 [Mycetocola zhadangensis]